MNTKKIIIAAFLPVLAGFVLDTNCLLPADLKVSKIRPTVVLNSNELDVTILFLGEMGELSNIEIAELKWNNFSHIPNNFALVEY
ncbi:MAG: hypothetical protein LBE91_02995 [Tannerella sp.]|jgi:hypothetical protein|nr:hypothetical protein [Tannerella sp.]